MLDGVHLGGVELDVGGLHHVPGDGAGEQAADELGHLDHGDVVQEAVDGHTQGAQQQDHAEHGHHPAVAQLVDLAAGGGLGLVVGVGLQVVAVDQEGGHRPADEGAHDVAQGTGGDAHRGGGLRGAPFNEDGTEGGGGAHAAGHGGGGALEGQEGVHPHQLAHQHAQHILEGDEQAGGQGDHQAQLAAGVADQLPAEAEAHAHEEHVLTQVLDGLHIKGQGDDAAALQNGDHDGEQQTGHHRGGNGELAQQTGVIHQGVAQEDHNGGKAEAGEVLKLKGVDRAVCSGGKGPEIGQDLFCGWHKKPSFSLICCWNIAQS